MEDPKDVREFEAPTKPSQRAEMSSTTSETTELALTVSAALEAAFGVAVAFAAATVGVATATGAGTVVLVCPAAYADFQSIPMLSQSRDSQSTLRKLLALSLIHEHQVELLTPSSGEHDGADERE